MNNAHVIVFNKNWMMVNHYNNSPMKGVSKKMSGPCHAVCPSWYPEWFLNIPDITQMETVSIFLCLWCIWWRDEKEEEKWKRILISNIRLEFALPCPKGKLPAHPQGCTEPLKHFGWRAGESGLSSSPSCYGAPTPLSNQALCFSGDAGQNFRSVPKESLVAVVGGWGLTPTRFSRIALQSQGFQGFLMAVAPHFHLRPCCSGYSSPSIFCWCRWSKWGLGQFCSSAFNHCQPIGMKLICSDFFKSRVRLLQLQVVNKLDCPLFVTPPHSNLCCCCMVLARQTFFLAASSFNFSELPMLSVSMFLISTSPHLSSQTILSSSPKCNPGVIFFTQSWVRCL